VAARISERAAAWWVRTGPSAVPRTKPQSKPAAHLDGSHGAEGCKVCAKVVRGCKLGAHAGKAVVGAEPRHCAVKGCRRVGRQPTESKEEICALHQEQAREAATLSTVTEPQHAHPMT
jgi:hypothetical protein